MRNLFIALVGLAISPYFNVQALSPLGKIEPSIVGGKELNNDHPITKSTVCVMHELSHQCCSGSLIAENFVVTAAHCIHDSLSIVFGSDANKHDSIKVAVKKTFIHPKANFQAKGPLLTPDQYDIGLIELSSSAPIDFNRAPLLTKGELLSYGERAIIAGYGAAGMDYTGANLLRGTEMRIRSGLGNTEIWFHEDAQRGPWAGDSGGPAFLLIDGRYYLFGVANRAVISSDSSDAIYANILKHIDWISEIVPKTSFEMF